MLSIWIFFIAWIILLISWVLIHSMNLKSTNSNFKMSDRREYKNFAGFSLSVLSQNNLVWSGAIVLVSHSMLKPVLYLFFLRTLSSTCLNRDRKSPWETKEKTPKNQNWIDRSEICRTSRHHLWLLGATRWFQNNPKPFFRIQLSLKWSPRFRCNAGWKP